MAAISSAHLEWRMSGGATNTVGNNSLGGIMSSTELLGQDASYVTTTIAGVLLRRGSRHSLADIALNPGVLTYTNSSGGLRWNPPGTEGQGAEVVPDSDGKYILFGANVERSLIVDVTFASLPGADDTENVDIDEKREELFDDVTASEAFVGDINYRCLYLTNVHPTNALIGVTIWIGLQTVGDDDIAIGLDPAGVGNGSTTGVATTIVNEATAPAGVTFSAPTSQGTGISVPGLAAGEGFGLWIRRNVPGGTTAPQPNNESRLSVAVAF